VRRHLSNLYDRTPVGLGILSSENGYQFRPIRGARPKGHLPTMKPIQKDAKPVDPY
jgi:hypothetical protein